MLEGEECEDLGEFSAVVILGIFLLWGFDFGLLGLGFLM